MKNISLTVRECTAAMSVFALLCSAGASYATTTVPVEEDFFTTAWAFGAPYVRDSGRGTIGVSTPDPFLTSGGGTNGPVGFWEETTYFTFNFDPAAFSGSVPSAVLQVETFLRPFGTIPSDINPFAISAHRVTDDPTSIDPTVGTGPGSFFEFKSTEIGAAEDTVSITGEGIYEWDITGLVNEWIANGDTAFDYSIAMTGRIGNPADTAGNGFFHAFANSGEGSGGLAAQLVIVPSPSALAALSMGSLLALRRRRS